MAKSLPIVTVDDMVLSSFSYESTFEITNNYLNSVSQPPDGIFAFSDTAAMAFIHAFEKAGIKIPREVSVVGYNDIPYASFFHPAITTVRQDTYVAGEILVNKLMKIIDGKKPRSAFIPTELVIGIPDQRSTVRVNQSSLFTELPVQAI